MSETHNQIILSDGFVGCTLHSIARHLHTVGHTVVTKPGEQLMLPGTADGQESASNLDEVGSSEFFVPTNCLCQHRPQEIFSSIHEVQQCLTGWLGVLV